MLRAVAAAAPMAAQAVLLAALLAQRQWLFALMVGAGCIGSVAALAVRHGGQDAHASRAVDRQPAARAPVGAALAKGAAEEAAPGCPDLEHLLGLHGDDASWRTISRGWLQPPPSLCVPIGVQAASPRPFTLDLAADGPHAIVAGTTGSGKSVLLQSWCIAMAALQPPWRLQFLFLDFKGGSALDMLSRLPHVRGCVSDLDLGHAVRALAAAERELKAREALAAACHASSIDAMPSPPPRLVIVVDEFHALSDQLPDYMDRLVRVASLGRSLGMHLVACTQNPMGQISGAMKANMALRVCLRVKDAMQSQEMIGTSQAACLDGSRPGSALAAVDGSCRRFQCAASGCIGGLLRNIDAAAMMHRYEREPPLFSTPLPATLSEAELQAWLERERAPLAMALPIGLEDDGVALHVAWLPLDAGNIAIIGPQGHGKTNTLRWLRRQPVPYGLELDVIDDADRLLDPLNGSQEAQELRRKLADARIVVAMGLTSSRHLRIPEHCTVRLVFPTGERAVDLADGIPATIAGMDGARRRQPAGRAVLIAPQGTRAVQCVHCVDQRHR